MNWKWSVRIGSIVGIAVLLAFVQLVKGLGSGDWWASLFANLIALFFATLFVEELLRRVQREASREEAYEGLGFILRDLGGWQAHAMNMARSGAGLDIDDEQLEKLLGGHKRESLRLPWRRSIPKFELHEKWTSRMSQWKELLLKADAKAQWKGTSFYWVEEALIDLERLTEALRRWEGAQSIYVAQDLRHAVIDLRAALSDLESLIRRAKWEVTRDPWHRSLLLTDEKTLRSSPEHVNAIADSLGKAYGSCLEKMKREDSYYTWVSG